MKRFVRLTLCAVVVSMLAAACAAPAAQPTCGASLCVTAIRPLRVQSGALTLLFQLTAPDGSVNEANPPAFTEALSVRFNNQAGDELLFNRTFMPEEFICLAGTNVPGAEGTLASACLLTLSDAEFSAPLTPGLEVLLTIYSETFPLALWQITLP
jgi:hypothetical protein